jgi:hypothetical protein
MKTDQLIEALARGDGPVKPISPARKLVPAIAIGMGLGLALLAATVGLRADIGVNLPIVLAKAAFSGAFAMVGVLALMRLARPGAPFKAQLRFAIALLAAALAVGAIALIGEAPERRFFALTRGGFPWCLVLIPAFGAPAAAALAWFVRDLAPTRLTITGAAIGAAAGGVGAMVYAMYCPIDGVAFVSIWYALAIALSSALGALFTSRLLRW